MMMIMMMRNSTIKLKSACREPDLSLSGLDPFLCRKWELTCLPPWVAKEKIGTLLPQKCRFPFRGDVLYCMCGCDFTMNLPRLGARTLWVSNRGPPLWFTALLLRALEAFECYISLLSSLMADMVSYV